ncbi:LysR family transcriptional regulator [Streptomyces sp. NPDC059171]|uniref:LysR family transcriptional regulator n=1 Tax=Streptomyces sp. NPDC059171 TaxID=3346755 RepID=UPI0036CA9C7E
MFLGVCGDGVAADGSSAAEPATTQPSAPLTKPTLFPPCSARPSPAHSHGSRLSRFLAAHSYPTLTEAARDLGIHQSALVTQINRLEADLGQPLFERAERGRAMKLARLGKQVVAAVRELQERNPGEGSLTTRQTQLARR